MQVLKTLLKGLGVEISHTSFKELFSAIEIYCYWLDPDKRTLRHEDRRDSTRRYALSVDFIAKQCQNLNKTVSQPGLRDLLMQVLAYDNAKSKC